MKDGETRPHKKRQFRFFWLIFFSQACLIIIALILYSFVTYTAFNREFKKHILNDLSKSALFFSRYVKPEYFDTEYIVKEKSSTILQTIPQGANIRLTLINVSGEVTLDTNADKESMENHRDRPEVIKALAGKPGESIRYSRTLQEKRIYYAIPYWEGEVIRGVIRVSYSFSFAEEAFSRTVVSLQKSGFIIVLLSILLIYLLDKKVTLSINKIKLAAMEISKGNYDVSIPRARSIEIEELGQSISDMSGEIQRQMRRVEEKNQLLQKLTMIDELTQLGNRRKFDTFLKYQWLQCQRNSSPISLIIGDIDYFKLYNDSLGHPEGDICLRKISTILSGVIKRSSDILTRIGGEEFGIILPDTDADKALGIAEKIQNAVKQEKIPHPTSPIGPNVSISLGIHTMIPEKGEDMRSLFSIADKNLYKAKNEGRNRISNGL